MVFHGFTYTLFRLERAEDAFLVVSRRRTCGKYILLYGQINNLDKCVLKFVQIHFAIWRCSSSGKLEANTWLLIRRRTLGLRNVFRGRLATPFVFVKNKKCICQNFNMYLSTVWNVFLQPGEECQNYIWWFACNITFSPWALVCLRLNFSNFCPFCA